MDEYIGAKVVVPGLNSIPVLAMVKKIKCKHKYYPILTVNTNPFLDT